MQPDNDIGWYNLGNAYRELHKYRSAENAFLSSMKYTGKDEIDACLGLGSRTDLHIRQSKIRTPVFILHAFEKSPKMGDFTARWQCITGMQAIKKMPLNTSTSFGR